MSEMKKIITIALVVGAGVILTGYLTSTSHQGPIPIVKVPTLSPQAMNGQTLFNGNCSACHGKDASGSDNGPPLVHKIYEPNHHGDGAFLVAVKRGVRAHHWNFGNMPPQPQVTQQAVKDIITYVRALQRANDIY